MQIEAIHGNIVEIAPERAEASVFWLKSGFTHRDVTGRFQLPERYPDRIVPLDFQPMRNPRRQEPAAPPPFPAEPWRTELDMIYRLDPPDVSLRYLYFFANPEDVQGCADVEEVQSLVKRALTRLSELEVRRVAMIHIPAAARSGQHEFQPFVNRNSAEAMIAAIKDWDRQNPSRIDHVFLVDLENGFEQFL